MMKPAPALVYLVPAVIFVQLFLGGAYLVSNAGYPSIRGMDSIHPASGLVVVIISLAALTLVWVSKPRNRTLGYVTISTFVLVILTGLAADKSTMLPHDTLATLAFGVSIVGAMMAGRASTPSGSVSNSN